MLKGRNKAGMAREGAPILTCRSEPPTKKVVEVLNDVFEIYNFVVELKKNIR